MRNRGYCRARARADAGRQNRGREEGSRAHRLGCSRRLGDRRPALPLFKHSLGPESAAASPGLRRTREAAIPSLSRSPSKGRHLCQPQPEPQAA